MRDARNKRKDQQMNSRGLTEWKFIHVCGMSSAGEVKDVLIGFQHHKELVNFVFSHNSCKFEGRAKIIINRECLVHAYLYDNQGDESCANRFSNMILSKKHRHGKTTCEIRTFVQHHLPFRYSETSRLKTTIPN